MLSRPRTMLRCSSHDAGWHRTYLARTTALLYVRRFDSYDAGFAIRKDGEHRGTG